MGFTVSIDEFEGPLDLMLHLIKDNKLDLFDLDMIVLTDQYLLFLKQMQEHKLEIASEFLSELAGLLEYKSKKLLPKEKVEILEEYEEDQREKLVKRLLEYQVFKTISEDFEKSFEERQLLLEKPLSEEVTQWIDMQTEEEFKGNAFDLYKAMQRIMKRQRMIKPQESSLRVDELSVEERVVQLKKRLQHIQGKVSFEALCEDCTSLHMIIVTFLSVLDLVKVRYASVTMDKEQNIWLLKGEEIHA